MLALDFINVGNGDSILVRQLDGKLAAYRHEGFWKCMDTMRDKGMLDELWNSGQAPWKRWE